VQELSEYFSGKRTSFDLPLNPSGSAFQKRVWEQLRLIPCGQTRSYGDIAKAVGNPKAARAVGHANNRNPIMIIIPCHRVIGADGSLVGFGGGLEVKQFLLDLEARHA
jgi:methylated-DNA-[protein]-cysteine S-methyltransferase